MKNSTDILIVGGGLAGLSLALQVHKECPDLDITVAEARAENLPQFIGKVGESTVEVGAHYLSDVVGQSQHLDNHQLRKFGLRFFFNEGCEDLSRADEVGVSNVFEIPTYQIERGSFENHLVDDVKSKGIDVLTGVRVTDVSLGQRKHLVTLNSKSGKGQIRARWVLDASGRQNVLRKKLALEKNMPHTGSAVWFRVNKVISVDDWSSDQSWRNKFGEDKRWLSTNHLMGRGYWVWIIPLAGGATSVGIVFDDRVHPWSEFTKYEKTLEWLKRHQPLCAAALEEESPLDYRVLKHFSSDASQVYSADGWGLTGESGNFLDPFYSPGTDFIAYSNTFITDLVRREKMGEPIEGRSFLYQQMFDSITESTELLYRDQCVGYGSQRMMSLKMVWDYAYYWGVLGLLFFSESLTDLDLIRAMNSDFQDIRLVNQRVQALFRKYSQQGHRQTPQGHFVDQLAVPILCEFNRTLKCSSNLESARGALGSNIEKLHQLAILIEPLLLSSGGSNIQEQELVGDLRDRLAS